MKTVNKDRIGIAILELLKNESQPKNVSDINIGTNLLRNTKIKENI